METIKKLESVTHFNSERGHQTWHPSITVIDQSKSSRIKSYKFLSGLYIVFLKMEKCADLLYGKTHYDYQEETLLFIAPGQLAGFEQDNTTIQPNGWALAFHPDFIRGSALDGQIRNYHYFSYDVREALHVSPMEKSTLVELFRRIQQELIYPLDKHSRKLVISHIELFLNYCDRFYDRQFVTREHQNKDILTKFEEIVDHYFAFNQPVLTGLVSVAYCAKQLNLSPKYFGELIKKQTSQTAQEYIQSKRIDIAKQRICDSKKSISEIAYEMGFKYPQHFTRLFKQKVGHSPRDYRLRKL